MPASYRIIHPFNTGHGLEEMFLAYTRATIMEALRTLADNPCPDTFLGRKTQEPFPSEDVS